MFQRNVAKKNGLKRYTLPLTFLANRIENSLPIKSTDMSNANLSSQHSKKKQFVGANEFVFPLISTESVAFIVPNRTIVLFRCFDAYWFTLIVREQVFNNQKYIHKKTQQHWIGDGE